MFPCYDCGDAAGQVQKLADAVSGVNHGTLWLDIEGSQYWGSHDANKEFYKELVDASRNTFSHVGVYSSIYQWQDLFGDLSFSYGSDLPLWVCF